MAKKTDSDADFIELLRAGRNAAPAMVLNKPPAGRGKSLDELLAAEAPATGFAAEPTAGSIAKIGLDRLHDSPFQPRLRYDDGYIRELCGSLVAVGQHEVITVRAAADGFEIINGHCRVRAARLAGWTELDARIVAADDREAQISALVQNEARKDLSDYERARLYRRALDTGLAKNQAAVAKMFGCSEGRVSQALSMLALPGAVLGFLDQRPALFGYRTAKDILDLAGRHPGVEDTLVQAVARLVDGAPAASLKGWVEQALARRQGRPRKADPVRIAGAEGRLKFKARVTARQVVVDVLPGTDPDRVHQWIVEELRRRSADPAPPTDPDG